MSRGHPQQLALGCTIAILLSCCLSTEARISASNWPKGSPVGPGQRGTHARRLAQTAQTVSNGADFAAALNDGTISTIALSGNIVRVRRADLEPYGGTVRVNRVVNVISAIADQPAAVDFSAIVDAVHVGANGGLNFLNCVVQGFASPFQPSAAKVTERIQGQGSWPTFTADPGAIFGGFNVTVYSLLPDCSTFATNSLAQAQKALGNDSVVLLGPSTILLKHNFTFQLPIIVRATNATVGNVTTSFADAVSICLTDNFAPGNNPPDFPRRQSGNGGVAWWVWLLVTAAAVAIVALLALLLMCLRRRLAARQMSLPLPAPKDSQESLDVPVAHATAKSAMEQRILISAFQDLAAKSAVAAAPSSSSHSSAAEAALLEAWRSRQLSSDSAADEVELGPMIGRGGFGQVHKARWRGALVAVKIVNSRPDQIRDIRILRETLFSTSLLHPNIVVTYRVITIPTPDPLERPSLSTAGSHSSAGRSSATASHNNTGGSASTLEQLREEGQGGTMLSDRASAFAAASAAAQQQPGLRQQPGQPRQQQQDQEPRAGSAPVQSAAAPERSASGRFAGTSDGYRKRTMSVRVDLEAAIDEERYMAGEVEALAETWMLMEYCDRGSLEKALLHDMLRSKADGKVDLVKLYKTLLDIAAGMQYLHSANILHGDLKLGNILLKSTATDLRGFIAKICDFGMSRLMDATKTHVSTSSMGTISYQPPELLCGQGLSKACDVYAFGVIMHELFSGETAFKGANLGHLIFQIVHKRERPPVPEDCPAAYAELMDACWQHEASKRPTFAAVLTALQTQYSALRAANGMRATSAPAAASLQPAAGAGAAGASADPAT